MKLLFDIFPVLLFFVAYKFFGIFIATGVAIAASFAQVLYQWLRHQRPDSLQIITLILITVLGTATILLHNELFIKWKPTAIYWAFALLFLGSQFIGNKPFIQRLMQQQQIELAPKIWLRLNLSWVIFFFATGLANLYVVYNFNTSTWVNFKVFGITGLMIVFIIIQAIYLAKHIKHHD